MQNRIGPYEVVGEIGRGAMGRVLKVRHPVTGIVRALKLIGEAGESTALVARFKREAELLARVGGDVVAVHETGLHGTTLWYAMDFCDGGSLAARLEQRRTLPWPEAAAIVAKVARTIARCHQAGVIHRDVKPENVLFDDRGEPRLSDFGCARDLVGDRLTKTGATVGTALYMPIEQLRGAPADAKVDVYGLGVLLYELVTGSVPYDAETWVDLAARIEAGAWVRTRALDPANPPLLDSLIGRALAKSPADRPTAAVLAAELEDLVRHFAPRPAAEAPAPRRAAHARAAVPALLAMPLLAGAIVLALRPPPPAVSGATAGADPALVATRSAPVPARARQREALGWRLAAGDVRSVSFIHRSMSRNQGTMMDSDRRLWLDWSVRRIEGRRAVVVATIARIALRRSAEFEGDVPNHMLDLADPLDFDSSRERDARSPLAEAVGGQVELHLDTGTGAVTSVCGVAAIHRAIAAASGARWTTRYRFWDLSSDRAFQESLDHVLHVLPDEGEVPGWPWEIHRRPSLVPYTSRMRPALRAPAESRESGAEVEVTWAGSAGTGDVKRAIRGAATFGPRGLVRSKQHEDVTAHGFELATDHELAAVER